jgi:hypothetical protein
MEEVAMKIKSGGGITSNKYRTSKAPKVEPIAKKASPAGVNQMGVSTAFKKEPVISGQGYTPAKVGPTGIGKATVRPDVPGPGSGRTTYASGSQGATPPAKEMEKGRDILSEYGKDIPGRR